jgi:hypothetical protein
MPKALGADVDRSPNAFGTDGLSGVGGEAKAGLACLGVEFSKRLGSGAAFVASDADPDDRGEIRPKFGSFPEDARGLFGPEVPDSVEDPEHRDAQFLLGPDAGALHAEEKWFELAASPVVDDAHGYIDFGVDDALGGQPFEHAPSRQFVILGGLKVLGDGLEGHQETGKVGVLKQSASLSHVKWSRVVAFAQLDQRLRSDGALEVQVQFGFGQAADVGHQVHEG